MLTETVEFLRRIVKNFMFVLSHKRNNTCTTKVIRGTNKMSLNDAIEIEEHYAQKWDAQRIKNFRHHLNHQMKAKDRF